MTWIYNQFLGHAVYNYINTDIIYKITIHMILCDGFVKACNDIRLTIIR